MVISILVPERIAFGGISTVIRWAPPSGGVGC